MSDDRKPLTVDSILSRSDASAALDRLFGILVRPPVDTNPSAFAEASPDLAALLVDILDHRDPSIDSAPIGHGSEVRDRMAAIRRYARQESIRRPGEMRRVWGCVLPENEIDGRVLLMLKDHEKRRQLFPGGTHGK